MMLLWCWKGRELSFLFFRRSFCLFLQSSKQTKSFCKALNKIVFFVTENMWNASRFFVSSLGVLAADLRCSMKQLEQLENWTKIETLGAKKQLLVDRRCILIDCLSKTKIYDVLDDCQWVKPNFACFYFFLLIFESIHTFFAFTWLFFFKSWFNNLYWTL